MPKYLIEWGVSGLADDPHILIKEVIEAESEAEALATAKDLAHDLYESNKPTIWWKAETYKTKTDTKCTGTAAHPTS